MLSNSMIEKSLRQAVRHAVQQSEEVTVNLVRTRVEEELQLGDNFFKHDSVWKAKSKDIISSAFDEHEGVTNGHSNPSPKIGSKRRSPEQKDRPQKRTKRQTVVESDDGDDDDGAAENIVRPSSPVQEKSKTHQTSAPKSKPVARAKAKIFEEEESQDEVAATSTPEHEPTASSKTSPEPKHGEEAEESDMSVLIDEVPPPKKKRQKKATAPNEKKPQPKTKDAGSTLSTDEEHVKTLQSQLRKCGVTKLWHRELAACDTPKDKVKHLRRMLDDVGMTGRFSVEKAKLIKESRELAADLEATKEYEQTWGAQVGSGRRTRKVNQRSVIAEDNSDESSAPPAMTTGLVDFGDSGDES